MASLFDQLKKSGLVNEQKAKQIKRQKYQETKQNKGKTVENEAALSAAKVAADKAEKDRLLNQERQQQQAQKSLQAEIKQIIEANEVKGYHGDLTFSYKDNTTIKTLAVNGKSRQSLIDGRLRIVCYGERHILIDDEAAAKIALRDASLLIPFAAETQADDGLSEEDRAYYAKFAIPDDLVW